MSVQLFDIVKRLDTLLGISCIEDVSRNGLQVEGTETVSTIGFAVDATELSFQRAAEAGCDMIGVHHGLFWKDPVLLTGIHLRRVKALISNNMSLYASHLPLDMHPELGNNIQICRSIGLDEVMPFGDYHGVNIGFGGELRSPVSVKTLMESLSHASGGSILGSSINHDGLCRRIAVVSGGATECTEEAALKGYDTFITGDVQHWAAAIAREYKINIISGGHYATETFGVKALMQHVTDSFDVRTLFIDVPTGW